MSLLIASHQLRVVTYGLAVESAPIQERLGRAWMLHLEHLRLDDAPGYMRRSLANLQQELAEAANRENPQTFAGIPDLQAIEFVQKFLFIADDLYQLVVIKHWKQLLTHFRMKESGSPYAKRHDTSEVHQEMTNLAVSPLNVQQRFQLAAYAMATGTGRMSQRFANAWGANLTNVDRSELPEYLQSSFGELRDQVAAVAGVAHGSDAILEIHDDQARHLASTLFVLSELITEFSIIMHYSNRL
jgi:hypothetical protein